MDEFVQQIADVAADAVAQLRDRSNDELDYSEASLAVVEEMLAEASGFVDDMPDEQVDGLVQLLGCYVFEVARREFGGRYCWHDDRDEPVLVVGEPAYRVAMIAFDKIRGRLSGDEGDNIPFFYQGFAVRARSAEPGTDALYV
jgi:hypothetical protein